MATYQRSEDLINLGAYASGANPRLDAAVKSRALLLDFLKQDSATNAGFNETLLKMKELAQLVG